MADLGQGGAAENKEIRYCLEQMSSLAEEVKGAIRAIADNNLSTLEASVQRQGEKASSLHLAITRLRQEAIAGRNSPEPPALKAWLQKAAYVLNGVNEEYAALIEHSGSSVRMLQALHGSRAGLQSQVQEFGARTHLQKTGSWEG